MGRFIGSFMDDNELDRPDLNKCPDCECYFPQDNCPICGRVCPEEMRAGNRKTVKKKKQRNGRSKTVQYIDWYHRWWFIILMLIIFPIMGIILLIGSPHSKKMKIAVIAVAVVYTIGSGWGINNIVNSVGNYFERPVDTSLSFSEYTNKCENLSPDDYFRNPDSYKKKYVKMELVVAEKFTDPEGYYSNKKYNDYYVCTYKNAAGVEFRILVRSCIQSGVENLAVGDKVTVYGECAGSITVYDMNYKAYSGPCVNAAYFGLN